MSNQNPIEIMVHPDNVPAFVKCASIIQSYFEKELYVPTVYVEDFFNFMKSKERYESQIINEKTEKQAAAAFAKISSNPLYQFEWKNCDLPGLTEKYTYNTQSVFFELILAFNLYEKDYPNRDRDEAIGFFFQAFEEDFKGKLSEETLKNFTSYKQIVISAILAEAIGFKITKERAPLKAYFRNSRNAVEKSWETFVEKEIQNT